MADDILFVVYYNGYWNENEEYCCYQKKGFTIKSDCTFDDFEKLVYTHLKIDSSTKTLDIRYKLEDCALTLKIEDEMDMKAYIQNKFQHKTMSSCPMFVICTDKVVDITQPASISYDVIDVESLHEIGEGQHGDGTIIHTNPVQMVSKLNRSLVLSIDTIYSCKELLQQAAEEHTLKNMFEYNVKRSCPKRLHLVCHNQPCNWELKASTLNWSRMFKVREFVDVHTCQSIQGYISQRNATPKRLGALMVHKFQDVYTPRDMFRDVKREHNVTLSYMKAYRAVQKALVLKRGVPKNSYSKIPSLIHIVQESNPGSHVELELTRRKRYLYSFFALYASRMSWQYCKPVVVVDGSFLKTGFKGNMLTAST